MRLLDPLRSEPIFDGDYIEASRFYSICRTNGVECGPIDMLICAVAIRLKFGILTCDTGLIRCISLLRSEGLSL